MASGPTPATEPRSAPQALPALTGLRGVAALWVVGFHLAPGLSTLFGGPAELPLARHGYLGVDVFFILSGFILSHVYTATFQPYSVAKHLHFLLVRLARIYPLHLFALCALAVLVVGLPGFADRLPGYPFFSPGGFVVSALLLQNWWPHQLIWNGPAWSLSAEWAAYMAFPLPLLLARRVPSRAWALALAFSCLLLVSLAFALTGHDINSTGKSGFLRLAGEFTAGCLIFRSFRLGLPERFPCSAANACALAILAAVLLIPGAAPFSVPIFGFLILSLTHSSGRLNALLAGRTAVFLGEISYSIYLMHWMLVQVEAWALARFGVSALGARIASAGLLTASLFVVPMLTWMWVEKPARRFGRRLADRLAPRSS
jgi:peptidoglycan/LPS O-acetylase OafA/YrhL